MYLSARASVAQPDRAAGFEPAGREFEPLRACQLLLLQLGLSSFVPDAAAHDVQRTPLGAAVADAPAPVLHRSELFHGVPGTRRGYPFPLFPPYEFHLQLPLASMRISPAAVAELTWRMSYSASPLVWQRKLYQEGFCRKSAVIRLIGMGRRLGANPADNNPIRVVLAKTKCLLWQWPTPLLIDSCECVFRIVQLWQGQYAEVPEAALVASMAASPN